MTVLLLCLLSKHGPLLHVGDALLLLLGLTLITALQWRLNRKSSPRIPEENPRPSADLWIVAFLMLYLSTGAVDNNWFFIPRWSISDKGIGDSWLLRSLGITCALALYLHFRPGKISTGVFAVFALMVMGICLIALEKETGFKPIYRVDHPSFQYRFASFLATFPRQDFYDPHWNGGKPVPYLVASGTWSLAIVWLPLMNIISIEQLYTPMIAVTFLFLVPLSGFAASRLLGGTHRAAWITFILFMVPGQRFFTHVLHYGTTPSVFCLCLFPLILALLWKLLHAVDRRALALTSLALIAVSGITLCWPGSLLSGIPLVLALISVIHLWTPRRLFWMFLSAAVLVLLLFPLALVPLRHSPIDRFIGFSESKALWEIAGSGLRQLAGLLQGIHPVMVIFAATCGFLDPDRTRGRMMGTFIFSAALLAGWGEEYSPLLQWERLIIPAAFLGAVAAGLGIDRLLDHPAQLPASLWKFFAVTGNAWILSLLLLGGYQGTKIYSNQGQMDFRIMPAHTQELVDWLKQEVPDGGRILIAGKAVHGYGGGKVANLPLLIGREMMACDYYGFSTKLVEYQYPPRRVLNQGPGGVFLFINLYNVTHVMTYHQSWKDALDRHPEYYTRAYQNGRVSVYKVHTSSNMFLEGSGRVQADFTQIQVDLDSPQPVVILKYNWSDALQSTAPAELFAVEKEFDIRLIGIRPNGAQHITVEYRP